MDVPDQYKKLVKELINTIGNSAERLLPIAEELGCDSVELICGKASVIVSRATSEQIEKAINGGLI